MNLSNNNDKKSKKSGIASLFGRGSVSKIGKSQFPKSMGGIMERLKGLSRKDLALVGVGLSVLVAAPVAEYMISKPADSANMLTSGFSSRDAQGASALASLYEPGINALSQGSADGSGEVITPLSARDPYALILGAQPEQQPAMPDYSSMSSGYSDSGASSSASSAPSDYNDLRDSVKDSAKRGAAKAVQSAGTPTVIKKMVGRGSSFSFNGKGGGASISRKISAPEKANVGAKQSKMVNPVSSNGFKGATNTPNSVDSSAADRLRAKANAQGGYFSGASAVKSADAANAIKMNDKLVDGSTGSSYDGTGYGHGKGWKDPSNRGADNRFNRGSFECKTLTCEAAKKRQDAALKWEEYLKYDLPKEFIKMGMGALSGFITDSAKKIGQLIWNEDVDGVTTYYCLTKIDKKQTYCKKNAKIIKSSKKGKTIGNKDWVAECDCGIYTMSECKENYIDNECSKDGSQANASENNGGNNNNNGGGEANGGNDNNDGGNANGGGNNNNQEKPSEFDAIVKNYDDALVNLISQIAAVRAHPDDQNVVANANAVIDTYTGSLGNEFQNISNAISAKAKEEKSQLKEGASLKLTAIENYKKEVKAEGTSLGKLLNTLSKNSSAYLKVNADGSVTANNSEQLKAAVASAKKSYEENYKAKLESLEKNIQTHRTVISNINGHIDVADEQVSQTLFANSYKSYSQRVSGLKSGLTANGGNQLAVINKFLVDMDKYPLKEFANNTGTGNSNMKNADADDEYPSAKARTWRGLSVEFGSDAKTVAAKLKEETKVIVTNEEKAWEFDSPFSKDGVKPEMTDPKDRKTLKMSETDFYAPGYRIYVEIPTVIASAVAAMNALENEVNLLKQAIENIKIQLEKDGFDLEDKTDCEKNNNCKRYGDAGMMGAGGNQTHDAHNYKGNASWWNDSGLYYDVSDAQLAKGCKNDPQLCQDYYNATDHIHKMDRRPLDAISNKIQALNSKIASDSAAGKDVSKTKEERDFLQEVLNAKNEREHQNADQATFIGLRICLESGGGDSCYRPKTITDRYGTGRAGREAAKQAYNNWLQMSPYGADNSSSTPSVPAGNTGNTNNGTSGSNAGSGSTNTGNSINIPVPDGVVPPPDPVINPDTGQHLFTKSQTNKSINMEDASAEASSKSVEEKQAENKGNVESEAKDEEKKKNWWNPLDWFKKEDKDNNEKTAENKPKKSLVKYGWTLDNFDQSLIANATPAITRGGSQGGANPMSDIHRHYGKNFNMKRPVSPEKKGSFDIEKFPDNATIRYVGSVKDVQYGNNTYTFSFDAICKKQTSPCKIRESFNTEANQLMQQMAGDESFKGTSQLCIQELTIHSPGADKLAIVNAFNGSVCAI